MAGPATPGADWLCLNRVPWLIDVRRCALLVHDMQVYFLRPFPHGEPITRVTAHLRQLATACRDPCYAAG